MCKIKKVFNFKLWQLNTLNSAKKNKDIYKKKSEENILFIKFAKFKTLCWVRKENENMYRMIKIDFF